MPAFIGQTGILQSVNTAFGLTLQELRKGKGLSQEQLAFDARLSRNYISLLEKGQRPPTLVTLQLLSRALGTTLTYLASRVEVHLAEQRGDQ